MSTWTWTGNGMWIISAAHEAGAYLVGLSGLFTPSLDEMIHTVRELSREGIAVPILIGGAGRTRPTRP